jgi:hypothetical protein
MSIIPAERLREGQQIIVRGRVSFSRIAQVIDGPALQRSIEQARARGSLYPTTVPHTTINLVDAQVIPADPANATPEEQFVQEKIFPVKSGDNAGKQGFSIDNKSTFLPTVLELDPENPGTYRQLILERDLASGMDVTLVLQVFKPKGYEKRGLGLQQVVLNEPVRYYASAGLDTSALAARGIVVNGPIKSVSAADAGSADTAAAAAAFQAEADLSGFVPENTGVDASGLPVPMPGAQGVVPVPSPAAQQFPLSTPVAAPVATAPVAPAAPVQAAPAAPATAVETPEQQIARLQQELAEQRAAAANQGGASAFDAVPAAAAGTPGPWDVPGAGPAAFQG